MSLEAILKEAMGENANEEAIAKILEAASEDAKLGIESATKGLSDNKTKLLDQMARLKKNQMPDDFDKDAYDKYQTDKVEFDKKQKELDDKKLADEGQWDALKLQMVEKHNKSVSDLTGLKDTEIGQLRTALDKELIENAAIKAIEKEKGNSLFLLPHLTPQIKTINEEGKFSVQVLDAEGNPRIDPDSGNAFTISQLVAEMKANESFGAAFPESNAGSGNNANVGGGGAKGVNPWKADTKNITAQAKMNLENPTLASQMRKAAGVA